MHGQGIHLPAHVGGDLVAGGGVEVPRVAGNIRVLRTEPVAVGLHVLEAAYIAQTPPGLGTVPASVVVGFVSQRAENRRAISLVEAAGLSLHAPPL